MVIQNINNKSMIQKPNQELFSRAWRMSVDNREKVRCNAEAIFGKDACWTRCFDFKKPIEGHRHIKGIRFMTSNDGTTCMYTIRHDGNVDSVVDDHLKNTLITEIKTMPSSEKGICGWIKEVSRKYDDIEVEIKKLGGGLYWKRYNDGSGSILNSSGQILDFELPKYDNIQAVIYLGKYDDMEVLAIRSADFSISSVGLYDINGKNVVIIDDIIDTAGTLCNAANALKERGAKSVRACATHGVLSGPAIQRIKDSVLEELVLLDTIPVSEEKKLSTRHK